MTQLLGRIWISSNQKQSNVKHLASVYYSNTNVKKLKSHFDGRECIKEKRKVFLLKTTTEKRLAQWEKPERFQRRTVKSSKIRNTKTPVRHVIQSPVREKSFSVGTRTINKKRSQIHQNQDEKEQVGVESGNAVLIMLPKQ